ncbi:MAG: hypothetical protein ACM3OC_10210 [Deltaproteobacteria bacterium]
MPRLISLILCFSLMWQQAGFAQVNGPLDMSSLVDRTNPLTQDKFRPLHLRYLSYDGIGPSFNVMVDKGDSKEPSAEKSSRDILAYFLVGVTLPERVFWVNLRPDAPSDMLDPALEKTDMGRVMLEADVQLKKDVAMATSPKTQAGREYWEKLYKKAEELYGSDQVTIPTLARPWIVPGEIILREAGNSAYIYKATLKVMLEQDYLKGATAYAFKDERSRRMNEYASELMRRLIIPRLTREVNSAGRYAALRQVYYSLILASWFKETFRGAAGVYASRIDTGNLAGLTSEKPWSKDTYFNEYKRSFSEGEYNARESVASVSGRSVRTYAAGGIRLEEIKGRVIRVINNRLVPFLKFLFECKVKYGGISSIVIEPAQTAQGDQAVPEPTETQKAPGKDGGEYMIPLGTKVDPSSVASTLAKYKAVLNAHFAKLGINLTVKEGFLREAGYKNAEDTQQVTIDNLLCMQSLVSFPELAQRIAELKSWVPPNDDLSIIVIELDGKQYIADGHHRALAAKLLGETKIKARVLTAGMGYESSFRELSSMNQMERRRQGFGKVGELTVTEGPGMAGTRIPAARLRFNEEKTRQVNKGKKPGDWNLVFSDGGVETAGMDGGQLSFDKAVSFHNAVIRGDKRARATRISWDPICDLVIKEAAAWGYDIGFGGGTALRMIFGRRPNKRNSDIDIVVRNSQSASPGDIDDFIREFEEKYGIKIDVLNTTADPDTDELFFQKDYVNVDDLMAFAIQRVVVSKNGGTWTVYSKASPPSDLLNKNLRLLDSKTSDGEHRKMTNESFFRIIRVMAMCPEAAVVPEDLEWLKAIAESFCKDDEMSALRQWFTAPKTGQRIGDGLKTFLKIFVNAESPRELAGFFKSLGNGEKNFYTIFEPVLDFDAVARIIERERAKGNELDPEELLGYMFEEGAVINKLPPRAVIEKKGLKSVWIRRDSDECKVELLRYVFNDGTRDLKVEIFFNRDKVYEIDAGDDEAQGIALVNALERRDAAVKEWLYRAGWPEGKQKLESLVSGIIPIAKEEDRKETEARVTGERQEKELVSSGVLVGYQMPGIPIKQPYEPGGKYEKLNEYVFDAAPPENWFPKETVHYSMILYENHDKFNACFVFRVDHCWWVRQDGRPAFSIAFRGTREQAEEFARRMASPDGLQVDKADEMNSRRNHQIFKARVMAALAETVGKKNGLMEGAGEATMAKAGLDGGAPGGIDMRGLNIRKEYQLLDLAPFMPKGKPWDYLLGIDLSKECDRIQRLSSIGSAASLNRIKEFLAVCQARGRVDEYSRQVLTCLAQMLRQEECQGTATEDELSQVLFFLESQPVPGHTLLD